MQGEECSANQSKQRGGNTNDERVLAGLDDSGIGRELSVRGKRGVLPLHIAVGHLEKRRRDRDNERAVEQKEDSARQSGQEGGCWSGKPHHSQRRSIRFPTAITATMTKARIVASAEPKGQLNAVPN